MPSFAPNEEMAEAGVTRESPSSSSTQSVKIDLRNFLDKCKSRESYFQEPLGWRKIAAMPNYFHNMDFTNTFKTTGMRIIHYGNGRLGSLEAQLQEFDRKRNKHLRSLTKHQTRLPGQSDIKEEYDIYIEELEKEWTRLADNICRLKQLDALHAVSSDRHRDIVARVIDEEMLDEESALMLLGSPPELASISEPTPRIMDWFLHTKVGMFLADRILSLQVANSNFRLVPMANLRMVKVVTTTLFTLAVLVPVGILFLCDLTKAESFGVVVAFTFLFSLAVNFHQDTDMHKAMVAGCALSAVLITVMVQLVSFAPE